MKITDFAFNRTAPTQSKHNAFLVTVFSKSKKKVTVSKIIPIRETSWDETFNNEFGDFLGTVLNDYSGYKERPSAVFADMSFKLVDFSVDHDDNFDDFDDFNNFKEKKDKNYFVENHRLQDDEIKFINQKDQSICVLKISENDLIIHFERLPDLNAYNQEHDDYFKAYDQAVSDFKSAMMKKHDVSSKEFDFITSSVIKTNNDYIYQPHMINNVDKTLGNYTYARDD